MSRQKTIIQASAEASIIPTSILVGCLLGYFIGGFIADLGGWDKTKGQSIGLLLGLTGGIYSGAKTLIDISRIQKKDKKEKK